MRKTTPDAKQLLSTATHAAHAAGRALMKRFRTKLKIAEKPGEGLVTNADLEAEKAALKIFKKDFPEFGVLTEESAQRLSKSPGRWVLDPLDGTTNFAHGFPVFCVAIAAEWEGKVVAGVIFHPVLKETYTAIRGKGAFVNGVRMRVSKTTALSDAFLSTGFSSRKDQWLSKEIEAFAHLSRSAYAVRRPGSAALDLANVARGCFDGFWERGLKPWDVAAGSLMIEEAGGSVTNFSGKSMQLDSGEVVASNGALHQILLREACR